MTEEHSLEHRLLLAKASTHGKKFSATGGLHLTSDDVLIGSEYAAREKEKESLLKHKSRRQRQIAVEDKAQAIIEKKAMSINNNWTVGELNSVLSWHKVTKLDKMSKDDKLQKWEDICRRGLQPQAVDKWTDDDENALKEASRTDLVIGDTALGRLQDKKRNEFLETARKFTPEEWAEIIAARSSADTATTLTSDANEGNE